MRNTQDFADFGQIEREEAGALLSAYGTSKDKTLFLESDVKVEFNPYSGYVFLVDGDYNCAMLNVDGELENHFSCPNCGNEGMQSEFKEEHSDSECCQEYAGDLGLK
jgi:predicted RNA-binding Zn-ribbon protein involved in translation (DUF1610 family)